MARFRSSDIKCFRYVQVLDDGRVLERTPNYGPKVYSITVWPDATMEQYEYRTHGYDTPSAAKRAVVDYLNAYPRTPEPISAGVTSVSIHGRRDPEPVFTVVVTAESTSTEHPALAWDEAADLLISLGFDPEPRLTAALP